MQLPFSDLYPFGKNTKDLKTRIKSLRKRVERGELELRKQLFDAYIQYQTEAGKKSIKISDDIIELGETLVAEGNHGILKHLAMAILIDLQHRREAGDAGNHETAFKRAAAFFESGDGDVLEERRKEWATELLMHADYLAEKNNAIVSAIAWADKAMNTLMLGFDDKSEQIYDWRAKLDIHRKRGHWKHEIGDRFGAITDFHEFEDILMRFDEIESKKTPYYKQRPEKQGNKIVIKVDFDEVLSTMATLGLQDFRMDVLMEQASIFEEMGDRKWAELCYNRAEWVSSRNRRSSRKDIAEFPAYIRHRKAVLAASFKDYEAALGLFNEAKDEYKSIIANLQPNRIFEVQQRLIHVLQERIDMLKALGRFEEAEEGSKELQLIYSIFVEIDKNTGNKLLDSIGLAHNAAIGEMQQGHTYLSMGKIDEAFACLEKAKSALETPEMTKLMQARVNCIALYSYFGTGYSMKKDYFEAEIWFKKSEQTALAILDEGDIDDVLDYSLHRMISDLYLSFAQMYENIGRIEDSISVDERALKFAFSRVRNAEFSGGKMLYSSCYEFPEGKNGKPATTGAYAAGRAAVHTDFGIELFQTLPIIRSVREKYMQLGKIDYCVKLSEQEVEIAEQLKNLAPESLVYDDEYVTAMRTLGNVLTDANRNKEAEAILVKAMHYYAEKNPETLDHSEFDGIEKHLAKVSKFL